MHESSLERSSQLAVEAPIDAERRADHPISTKLEQLPIIGSLVRTLHGALEDMRLDGPMRIVEDEPFDSSPPHFDDHHLI